MKKLLLGTTLLFGLAGPAFATGVNTIAIDDSAVGASVGSLAINQDTNSNTVSADGSTGTGSASHKLAINGPWSSIAITQTGAKNTFKGTSIISDSSSTAAALSATYTTNGGGGNVHQLNIGAITAPVDPSVTVNVTNDSTSGSVANTITDTLNGTAVTYTLAITGHGNTLTNNVKATAGITLTQDSSGGINGNSNTIDNEVGGTTAVTSYSHTLTVGGNSNGITNTVDGSGAKSITQSVTGDSNVVATNMSGAGAQTASLTLNGTFVDYAITTAGSGTSANVSLTGVGGVSALAPDIVRVEQTSSAGGATAILTVAATGGATMGTLGSIPGTYSGSGAGVAVYQNTSGAYLNASVTGSASGYKMLFTQ